MNLYLTLSLCLNLFESISSLVIFLSTFNLAELLVNILMVVNDIYVICMYCITGDDCNVSGCICEGDI